MSGDAVRSCENLQPSGLQPGECARGVGTKQISASVTRSPQAAGASFAVKRQKVIDFAFRSLQVTAETAKMLFRAYYGEALVKSYYDGCSQGGRQGLILAQRFPDDFDGILAGAPGLVATPSGSSRLQPLPREIKSGDIQPHQQPAEVSKSMVETELLASCWMSD
jgi:hypothetical protein